MQHAGLEMEHSMHNFTCSTSHAYPGNAAVVHVLHVASCLLGSIAGTCRPVAAVLQIATPLQKEGSHKWFTELSLPVSDTTAAVVGSTALSAAAQ
jgi:hypothetical protein